MLVRVSSGKDGIVEYLEEGVKSGRELSRDEIDKRVCIDGDLSVTEKIIEQLNKEDKDNNYLHITLSFNERDIDEESITLAYDEYKKTLMSAYDSDEFNIYAEIHFPKVKSYQNKKTGEMVERFPHVHMVIPQTNLVTQKSLNPYGLYQSNINYHDALQESVNRKFNLDSPYDNQRSHDLFKDNSEFISRYKGDTFKGCRGEFKKTIFESINNKNIRTMSDFETELSNYGEVVKSKIDSVDEYFKIKPPGDNKFIRLKDMCFKPEYIENRRLLRVKPTDKQVNKLVDEWVNTRSHEMKHIHVASPKDRKIYYSLPATEQKEFLDGRKREFDSKYNLRTRRRSASRKPGIERVGFKKFTNISNGLPNMPQRGLVRTNHRQGGERAESVLQGHANNNLEFRGTSRDNELRRPINRSRGGRRGGVERSRRGVKIETGFPKQIDKLKEEKHESLSIKPRTLSEKLLQNHVKGKVSQKDVEYFRVIRKTLDPERVLSHFEKTHGLKPEHYTTFKSKDGSARIKVGSRSFNVSDFCTQHMHQDWGSTKQILLSAYHSQNEDKEEARAVNSISFASNYVTRSYNSKDKLSRINESVRIFKHLQRQEKYGDEKMPIIDLEKYRVNQPFSNTIESGKLSLKESTDNFKRQQKLASELSLKMNDLVAAKDVKNNVVTFTDKNSAEKVFRDVGEKIIMNNRKPSNDHVAAAMTLAAEKFGVVKISGTKEFKQQVIDVAIAKNLNVVFDSAKMQAQFAKQKLEHSENIKQSLAKEQGDNAESPEQTTPQESGASVKQNGLKIIEHGEAPYMHESENSKSYYVTLEDGKTHWGVGLKDAVSSNEAEIGDYIDLKENGRESVVVKVPIKDENGKFSHTENKDVKRISWVLNVVSKHVESDNKQTEQQTAPVQFDVSYKWGAKSKKMNVTINGESASKIPKDLLKEIASNDKFLSKFSISEITDGKLDLAKAGGIPAVSNSYSEQGKLITEAIKSTKTLKM